MDVQDVAALGVLVGLLAGLWQYTRGQAWRRAEWAEARFREFASLHTTKVAQQVLDWNSRDVRLRPGEEPTRVTDDMLPDAFHPDEKPSGAGFDPAEVALRDVFSEFFDGLDLFDHYVKAGLVKDREIRPYFEYWCGIIADPSNDRKPREVKVAIRGFLEYYEYEGAIDLIWRLGSGSRA